MDRRARCGREVPPWIALQIVGNSSQKYLRKILQFLFANAWNATEVGQRSWVAARHLTQRDIGENNVGRHIALIRNGAPNTAEKGEELFVALDFAGALFCFCRLIHLLCECDRGPLTKCGAAGFRYLQRGKFSGGDLDEPKPQQFATDCLPGITLQFAANSVSR